MILAFASIKNGQKKIGKVTVSPSEFAEILTQIEIDVLTSMESYKKFFPSNAIWQTPNLTNHYTMENVRHVVVPIVIKRIS